MSRNLKAFLRDDVSYSAEELVTVLADVIPGRSIGDLYVTRTRIASPKSLVVELDDGSLFQMDCKKLN